jgi:protein TonB
MSARNLSALPRFALRAFPDGVPRRSSRVLRWAVVALLHGLALWALTHAHAVREALAPAPALTVSLVASPAPEAPQASLPVPARASPPAAPTVPVPVVDPVELAAPRAVAVALAPGPSVDATAVSAPAVPASAADGPAPTTVAALERQVQISQVAYLNPPVLAYPLAARRLREQGLVQVRVRIDEQGLPERFAIERSSGHRLLDDAALQTVRATRFKPYRENGVAMPFWVVMPLLFELDHS